MRYRYQFLLFALTVLLASGCSSSSAPSSTAENQGGSAPAAPAAPAKPAEPKMETVSLPAGTTIEVTVDQAVSSKTSNNGDRFAASIAAPVNANGREILAKGAAVSGTVTDAKSAGRFKGNAGLTLTLASVKIGGKEYNLKTSDYSEKTGSRGKRELLSTGIGAAAGAAIGAIAGGGKGAAIGAGAGGGAGAVGGALTGERDVEVPAETKLTFTLSEPLSVRLPAR
jgi:hypothetical protein